MIWQIYTSVEYYSAKKNSICNNMDGLGRYYARWSKSNRESQMLYDITYILSLKYNKLVNITTKERSRHRYREQTNGYQWEEGWGEVQYRGRGVKSTNF